MDVQISAALMERCHLAIMEELIQDDNEMDSGDIMRGALFYALLAWCPVVLPAAVVMFFIHH